MSIKAATCLIFALTACLALALAGLLWCLHDFAVRPALSFPVIQKPSL
jgi:hypothetical protein